MLSEQPPTSINVANTLDKRTGVDTSGFSSSRTSPCSTGNVLPSTQRVRSGQKLGDARDQPTNCQVECQGANPLGAQADVARRFVSGLGAAAVGALDVASLAPRVRLPRDSALESPQPGLHSDVGRGSRTRDATEKSWPEVRPFDAPLAGRARLPAKSFC